MRVVRIADVGRSAEDRADYKEILRVPDISVGVYRLPAESLDPQTPHTEDEVYFVVSGRGKFEEEGVVVDVQAGTVIFVAAGADHRFHSIVEDLTVLVMFGPAENSRKS